MGRVAEAIKKLHASSWKAVGFPPEVERYVVGGDEAALSAVTVRHPPGGGTYSFWKGELAAAWPFIIPLKASTFFSSS